MVWPDDLSPARGEVFSPEWGIRSTLLKTETQLGPDHHLCPSSSRTDENAGGNNTRKVKEISVFFLSPCPSFFLSLCLSFCLSALSLSLNAAQFNLSRERPGAPVFPVRIYTGFHWLFELQIWHFYFTICLACFASQFINCSFTHSLFILSASPQSVNDCLLSLNQFF